jgi:hypothetical protein
LKHAFVRYIEHHETTDGDITCFAIATGKAAKSQEAFIDRHGSDVKITITDWFEVPENWENIVSDGSMNDVFKALLGLDVLGDTPVVSDLLTTIFAAGFKCGQTHNAT